MAEARGEDQSSAQDVVVKVANKKPVDVSLLGDATAALETENQLRRATGKGVTAIVDNTGSMRGLTTGPAPRSLGGPSEITVKRGRV